MEYRLLGLSGCAVSALALGTLTFGNETSEADSFAQLDRFVSAGGTLIDTADVYADGRSGSADAGRGNPAVPRRRRPGRQDRLRRPVELPRLPDPEVRRPGRRARADPPGDCAAAVQPAGPGDRMGGRSGLPGRRIGPAALVAARQRLADR